MDGPANTPARKRELKEAELAGRRQQRNVLQLELDHFIQTQQDPSSVRNKLSDVDAEIAMLEEELRALG